MAKKNDQRAGGFETENTGGVLSGLLADEEHLDRRAMFRLGTWGVASVGAVVIAVLANQSAIKTRRDDAAALDLTRQSQQIQSVARESQNETRRLASAIDTLNGDRDRLYSRLTTIEQGLDSVTGAIAKQNAVAAAPPATPPSAPPAATPPSPAPTPQPVAQTAAPDLAPAVAPVTTTATATPTAEKPAPEKPRAEAKKPVPPATVAAATPAAAAPSTPPTPSPAAPLMASKSLMAPPDAAAATLIEPEPPAKTAAATPAPSPPEPASTASAPAPAPPAPTPDVAASKPAAEKKVATAEPAPTTAPAPLTVKRTEFAVDVGGANSVGGLRALWRGLLKSRSNAPLAALQPLIVVKERDNGLGMQLRLVAGPLGDAAAAARICARLAENEHPCETTVFDGQRLALKADDVPTATESISAKPEKPATEKSSPDKSAPQAAADPNSAPERPAATKPGSNKYFHRRGYYASKRAAVVEDPPRKPETSSSISSFFSSRIHPQ
jgi:hypothetical protein